MSEREDPAAQVRRLYEEAEGRTAKAVEHVVAGEAFGEILARVTENTMALTRIGFDTLDFAVRGLRLAGRADLTRLGRQLARNEDKLEMVLQEVERLQDQVRALERSAARQTPRAAASPSNGSGARSAARPRRAASSTRKSQPAAK